MTFRISSRVLSRILALSTVGLTSVGATHLPVSSLPEVESWFLPGGAQGALMQAGQDVRTSLNPPALTGNDRKIADGWQGIVSLDLHGTVGPGDGRIVLEAFEITSGKVFATGRARIKGAAPREAWSVIASSEHGGAEAENAFDGDPETSWHSRYRQPKARVPHWLGLTFAEPRNITGVRYLPRQQGFSNGVARAYRVEIRREGKDWEVVADGETDRQTVSEDRRPIDISFPSAVEVAAFRLVIVSDWSGGGFGTAGEVRPLGLELPEKEVEPSPPRERIWLQIPAEMMAALSNKRFGLDIKSTGEAAVVVGSPSFCRVNQKPGDKLLGRANGGLGPDKLGAGLLGFDGLAEHRQPVLSVMRVRPGTPAATAGLEPGDPIVAVAGRPLPINDLRAGWNWFERSHEAILGRAGEQALANDEGVLALTVLRDGRAETLNLRLDRKRAFTTMVPAEDPEAAALLTDMIEWLRDHQHDDGSWSGDIKRTTFAALAMLATGEEANERAAKRAVDWALDQFPDPEKHGNLGFWSAGYMMTLFAEWNLQTGDERVLEPIREARDWAFAGQHESLWGMPALGHGPSHLPYGRKSLVAPAIHLLIGEALAQRCGEQSRLWELLLPYMEHSWSDPGEGGHGAMGYNASARDLGEFWSRTGQFALVTHLRKQRLDMRDGLTAIMRERHAWFRNSHAYGEPGGAWGLLGLNLAAPELYREVIEAYRWWFSLAWEPGYGLRFTTPHMGAPYMGEDDLLNCIYALVLQGPGKTLHLTGARASP